MAELSDYLEGELLDHILKNNAWGSPATVYLALYITDPTDADSGTEVSGVNYARQTITFGTISGGVVSNSGAITFPTAGAGGWGTVGWVGIRDAASGGNLLLHSPLDDSKTVNEDDTFKINDGDLTVTLQ